MLANFIDCEVFSKELYEEALAITHHNTNKYLTHRDIVIIL